MTQTISPNFKLAGIVERAYARTAQRPPRPRYLMEGGICIHRYAISNESFRACFHTFFNDKEIFYVLLYLGAHQIDILIGGAYGDWIFLDDNGTIRIRHDTGIQRIKEYFGIA